MNTNHQLAQATKTDNATILVKGANPCPAYPRPSSALRLGPIAWVLIAGTAISLAACGSEETSCEDTKTCGGEGSGGEAGGLDEDGDAGEGADGPFGIGGEDIAGSGESGSGGVGGEEDGKGGQRARGGASGRGAGGAAGQDNGGEAGAIQAGANGHAGEPGVGGAAGVWGGAGDGGESADGGTGQTGRAGGAGFDPNGGGSDGAGAGGVSAGTSGTAGSLGGGGDGNAGRSGSDNGGAESDGGSAGSDGGQAGSGGEGGAVEVPVECDLDAPVSGCVPSSSGTIFVAPVGSDEWPGSPDQPVQTIGRALELAWAMNASVAVCSANYGERVELDERHGGLRIVGGFRCPGAGVESWKYDTESRARLLAQSRGYVMNVVGIDGLTIGNLDIVAASAVEPSENSIAVHVQASNGVRFFQSRIQAQDGADGTAGGRVDFTYPTQEELDGNDGGVTGPGASKEVTCPTGTTMGGAGDQAGSGHPGTPDYPDDDGSFGSGGGGRNTCEESGTGGDGANAPLAPDGVGARFLGELLETGWVAAAGTAGEDGLPGQGGGGGRGSPGSISTNLESGGGGGGAGSCGGSAGQGGLGGGASIALLAVDSLVTLDATVLVTGRGGQGGAGAAGQPGQSPAGRKGLQGRSSCDGGNGGLGASGGGGGGGAGGVSIGIMYAGQAPEVSNSVVFELGERGPGGLGGGQTNGGVDGDVAALWAVDLSVEGA